MLRASLILNTFIKYLTAHSYLYRNAKTKTNRLFNENISNNSVDKF